MTIILTAYTWHDGFLAGSTLGRVIKGVALRAEQQIILGCEGLFHKRAVALGTVEALLMPVAILIGQVLSTFKIVFTVLICTTRIDLSMQVKLQ